MNVLASSVMDFSMDMSILEKILFGLAVSAIGIIIVFAVLILVMFVIYLFQTVFGVKVDKSKAPELKSAQSSVSVSKEASVAPLPNPEEMVAAIAAATAMAQEELLVVLAAAVAAQEGCDPASSKYRIRSFRRIL